MQSLGPAFWTELPAQQRCPRSHWVARSDALAADLGLADWLRSDRALQVLSGNAPRAERPALASVYSGHQFGVWAGQLGDGRALLLGEIESPIGRQEIQLKAADCTPTRAWAMAAPCCARRFASSCVRRRCTTSASRPRARWPSSASPAPVMRENVETAAVVTRVAPSFLRFGHFEHFAHGRRCGRAAQLVVAVIDRISSRMPRRAGAVARLVGRGVAAHRALDGAMAGGGLLPWRDEHRQPVDPRSDDRLRAVRVSRWLRPDAHLQPQRPPGPICLLAAAQRRLVEPARAGAGLAARSRARGAANARRSALRSSRSRPSSATQCSNCCAAKVGLATEHEGDPTLIDELLRLMAAERTDYTITMRRLADFSNRPRRRQQRDARPLHRPRRFRCLGRTLCSEVARRAQHRRRTPAAHEVGESEIRAAQSPRPSRRSGARKRATSRGARRLLGVLQRPYDEQPEHEADAGFAPDWAQALQVSCLSSMS